MILEAATKEWSAAIRPALAKYNLTAHHIEVEKSRTPMLDDIVFTVDTRVKHGDVTVGYRHMYSLDEIAAFADNAPAYRAMIAGEIADMIRKRLALELAK